ncbi:hypothetical protein [Streptomyces sp. KL116D]|uniref:hypothetical protein n=1 Tax=Streptomyces sp. KL116D TaxID=3045152 RepID=UPI0035573798
MGACLPETVVTNGDLAEKLGVSPEWIEQRTGIRERRHVSGAARQGAAWPSRPAVGR